MTAMAEKEKPTSDEKALGPSIVLGLVGAIVVLLVLAGAIWGIGKLISNIREDGGDEDSEDQTVAEDVEETEDEAPDEDGEISDEAASEEAEDGDSEDQEEPSEEETEDETSEPSEEEESEDEDSEETPEEEEQQPSGVVGAWVVNNYKKGEINGDKYTVIWGDTLWEIAEARYGNGFEWKDIQSANAHIVGRLPNGSMALILPGQVLTLP